jgi:L-fuconolactonase
MRFDRGIGATSGSDFQLLVTLTIEAQVHAYERNHAGRPWVGELKGPSEVTGDQMVAAMDAVGVDAIVVSPFSLYNARCGGCCPPLELASYAPGWFAVWRARAT